LRNSQFAQEEVKEYFRENLLDFRKFCPLFLKINNKDGQIVPFVWNKPQTRFYEEAIEPRLRANKPIRVRLLKARQMGFSTLIEAFGFWYTFTHYGIQGAVMAHVDESAQSLYGMYRTFYECLDPILQIEVERSNVKEMRFRKLKSAMRVMTAESRKGAGRATTLQFLHTSETAFYPDAESTLTALLQALTDRGHHFDESTANGVGGRFYNDWQSSKEGLNDSVPCFFAWHELEEYTRPFESEQEKDEFLKSITPAEVVMQEAYKLTIEQLNWRRYTIRNKCGGDEATFMQEYPSNDDEAFLTTGRPVFDPIYTREQYERCQIIPKVQFSLQRKAEDKVEAQPDELGWWTLYHPIELRHTERFRFAVGCDVAEGLEQGDYSSMDVYDRIKDNYPLKFHAHCDPDELAEEQHKLHVWLKGSAYFCTERNNHGLLTVVNANKLRVPQFYTKRFEHGADVDTDQLGFKTTVSTRPILLGTLIEAVREKSVKDNDAGFWNEARTFVRNEKGKMSAQNKDKDPSTKCFDDRIFSKALAIHCHSWMPPYQQYSESEEQKKKREYDEWFTRNRMKRTQPQNMAEY